MCASGMRCSRCVRVGMLGAMCGVSVADELNHRPLLLTLRASGMRTEEEALGGWLEGGAELTHRFLLLALAPRAVGDAR
ncbi:hypothetical protein C8R47DRAFT_1091772 [Mycena vitilis]|nr:hypothetical protein C8R47DRAFT_1091772 [Mycena vitilis]